MYHLDGLDQKINKWCLNWQIEATIQLFGQRRIQDFPEGFKFQRLGGQTYYFRNLFPKTAWNWKNFGLNWDARPWRPLRSATNESWFVMLLLSDNPCSCIKIMTQRFIKIQTNGTDLPRTRFIPTITQSDLDVCKEVSSEKWYLRTFYYFLFSICTQYVIHKSCNAYYGHFYSIYLFGNISYSGLLTTL